MSNVNQLMIKRGKINKETKNRQNIKEMSQKQSKVRIQIEATWINK